MTKKLTFTDYFTVHAHSFILIVFLCENKWFSTIIAPSPVCQFFIEFETIKVLLFVGTFIQNNIYNLHNGEAQLAIQQVLN